MACRCPVGGTRGCCSMAVATKQNVSQGPCDHHMIGGILLSIGQLEIIWILMACHCPVGGPCGGCSTAVGGPKTLGQGHVTNTLLTVDFTLRHELRVAVPHTLRPALKTHTDGRTTQEAVF